MTKNTVKTPQIGLRELPRFKYITSIDADEMQDSKVLASLEQAVAKGSAVIIGVSANGEVFVGYKD